MIKIDTKAFIQAKFSEYYEKNSLNIHPPSSMEKREFGFLLLKERIMLRHKAFKTAQEFRDSFKTLIPSHVYFSSAYYERPEEEMEEKGWLGADLVFDIDADHISAPCSKTHDTWSCPHCKTTGRGTPPKKCPKCNKQKFEEKTWPCEICLESAKEETIKLIDILTNDLGFSTNEMSLSFSGHRGYHLHVESKDILTLNSTSRKEIVDYIVGIGLDPQLHGLSKIGGPNLDDFGWRGRIARGTYEYLLSATPEQLEKIGLPRGVIQSLGKHKERILESWKYKGPWTMIKGVSFESWSKIAEQALKNQAAKIDTVVTTDVHRLIRLADTLHGKTGLKKTETSIATIEEFDPLKSAVAFPHGTASVDVSEAPKFRVGSEFHGPYRNEKVELPMAAALFLLCKGSARITEVGSSVR
ncbi:MAG: DNA primase small subunit PriS [Candidatus Bathyarchaeota archaeon]|nr:DNA primase small subunit PriS [Candidatus Bathyarchaeota archaeon]